MVAVCVTAPFSVPLPELLGVIVMAEADGSAPWPEPAEQLGAIGQAVITTDLEGVVIFGNRAAEDLYGWKADEAIGRNTDSLTEPEVAREVAADIMAALRDGVKWSGGSRCAARTAAGSLRW